MLWIISEHAWYKVAGSGWWDFVGPHPIYASIFEVSRLTFAVTCLVARCLQSRCGLGFLVMSGDVVVVVVAVGVVVADYYTLVALAL